MPTSTGRTVFTRRDVLRWSAAAPLWTAAPLAGAACLPAVETSALEPSSRRPRVAALFTELRFRSHAYNILENFFEPYLFDGRLVDPGCDVVSFYADQFPADDMARDVARRRSVRLAGSIDEALCLGGDKLAVDAVLLIGEHGDYPYNELGQHLYPRKQFFDQAVAVMRRSKRFVPLFNDKHLSYRWDWAREMVATARRHDFPLMAGSSVPLAERRPKLELPTGAPVEWAVAVHGGGAEVYGFHGLELLQSFVESRAGGETGIRRIEVVAGDDYRRAVDSQRWPRDLFEAAMAAERSLGDCRQPPHSTVRSASKQVRVDPIEGDHAILVEYRDGLRGAVVRTGSDSSRWNFACRLRGETAPRATAMFNGPWGNRCLFKALSHAIQTMFVERRAPWPVERTLLTTGAVESAMRAYAARRPLDTPHLDVAYQCGDLRALRESGASWRRLKVETPQPKNFEPGDARLFADD